MKAKGRTKKSRIGHAHAPIPGLAGAAGPTGEDAPPRGWITPEGKFVRTDKHWETISRRLRLPGGRDPERGERNAHAAYSRGWISLGHGGAFNAIGHQRTFGSADHPALQSLRQLVAGIPHFSLRIEQQIGRLDPETGRHEDFEVREYDLMFFIRRGRLKPA